MEAGREPVAVLVGAQLAARVVVPLAERVAVEADRQNLLRRRDQKAEDSVADVLEPPLSRATVVLLYL